MSKMGAWSRFVRSFRSAWEAWSGFVRSFRWPWLEDGDVVLVRSFVRISGNGCLVLLCSFRSPWSGDRGLVPSFVQIRLVRRWRLGPLRSFVRSEHPGRGLEAWSSSLIRSFRSPWWEDEDLAPFRSFRSLWSGGVRLVLVRSFHPGGGMETWSWFAASFRLPW